MKSFNNEQENYINHEVRLRVHESKYTEVREQIFEIKNTLSSIQKDMKDTFKIIEQKVDSHFKWTMGTILGLFVGILGILYPILGGIILHLAKLI